ncbi:MAG: hypothetical protein N3A62_00610 [Thermodesulfovibrionales bacterium]|nr:hypothetical protein [Thermodesulfovibrionales bacterium]
MSYQELLYEIIKDDPRFIVLTSENRSAIRQIPQLLPSRFIDTGISEQSLVGIAAGLAIRKRIPIVHGISAFITMRAYEFIRTDIAYPNLPVKIVGTFAGLLSEGNGPTHQAVEDVALMRNMPNMVIFCPADEQDLMIGLREILTTNLPCYIRLNHLPPIVNHSDHFRIGKAEMPYQGARHSKLTILTYGSLFCEAFKACNILNEYGISTRLVNMRFIQPLDVDTILACCKDSEVFVTVEDHFVVGGLYSALCELFVALNINKRVYPIALKNKWFRPAMLDDIIRFEGLSSDDIAQHIIKIGGFNGK